MASLVSHTHRSMQVWGEPFTWVHGVACFFSFCGAVFVAQPSFIFGEREVSSSSNAKGGGGGTKLQHHIAWGFSFAAAVFAALAFLSIRALKVRDLAARLPCT